MQKRIKKCQNINVFLIILVTLILFIPTNSALFQKTEKSDHQNYNSFILNADDQINDNNLNNNEKLEFDTIYSTNPQPLEVSARNFPKNHPMNDYSDVLVIVNNNSMISKQVGQYFKEQRNIPDENMCFIYTTTNEVIDNTTFHAIRKQIEDHLVNNNLTLKINYLVTTKGVPLRIYFSTWRRSASVDSELGLFLGIYKRYIDDPINYQIANPYYQSQFEFSRKIYSIYLVTRLTGFNFDHIKQLIDNAAASADIKTGGGTFFFNRDPAKQSSNTYRQGNTWLELAHNTLQSKGFSSSRDFNTAFQTDRVNVAGYGSWGGFDSRYLSSPTSNRGFDIDSSVPYGVPDGWFFDISNYTTEHIEYNRSINSSAYWSINITRDAYNDTSYTAISQNITPVAGIRYYMRGLVKLHHIASTGGGGAFMQIKAFNSTNDLVWVSNGTRVYNSGIDTSWRRLYQVYYDPIPGVTKLTLSVVLNIASGSAYFDDIGLYEIRPRHSYVPGAIAEVYGYRTASTFDYENTFYRFYNELNVGELIADGITGVKGYVDYMDPYITSNTRVYTLFDAYTAGYNLAESFWMASPYVSWMDVVIGDPKCSPYFTLLPDLGIDINNITFSNDKPNQGDSILIDANVENLGGSDIYNFNVSFRIGNDFETSKKLGSKLIPYLGTGENLWVNISWDSTKYKEQQTIWVELDPDFYYREQNEENNLVFRNITINAYPFNAELKISEKSIYRGNGLDLFINVTDNETTEDQLEISILIKHETFLEWQKLPGLTYINDHWQVPFESNISSAIGWYAVRMIITDENLATFMVERAKVFEILNNAPLVSNILLTNTSVYRGGDLTISFNAYDFEDVITDDMFEVFTKYETESFKEIELPINFDQLTGSWQISYFSNFTDKLGKYDLKVILTDNDATNSTLYESDIFEILNNAPELFRLTVDKPSIYRGKFATIYIYGADLETRPEDMKLVLEQRLDFGSLNWSSESLGTKKWNPTVNRWEVTFFSDEKTRHGNYSFRAKLVDSDSAETTFIESESTLEILNNPPTAVILADVFSINEDEAIKFDGSTSTDYEDLVPSKFHWDFGDGTESTEEKPKHPYYKSGTYIVNLTVTDKNSAKASAQVVITVENVAPVADIKVRSTSASLKTGQIINFDGRESYDSKSDKNNLTFLWDFGDGNNSDLPNASQIYKKPGTYIITLVITDDNGEQSSKLLSLTVEPSEGDTKIDNGDEDKGPWFSGFGLMIMIIVIIIVVMVLLLIIGFFFTRQKKMAAKSQKGQVPIQTLEADVEDVPEFAGGVDAAGARVGITSEPGQMVKRKSMSKDKDKVPIVPTIEAEPRSKLPSGTTADDDTVFPEVEVEFAPDKKKSKAVSAMSMTDVVDEEKEEEFAYEEKQLDPELSIHLPTEGTAEDTEGSEMPKPGTKIDDDLEFVPPKIDLSDILEPDVQPASQHRQEISAAKERGAGFDFNFKKPSKQKKE